MGHQSESPATEPQKKNPWILIWQRAQWTPNPVWTQQRRCKYVAHAGNRTPVAWSPYRLAYPGSYHEPSSEQCVMKLWSTYPKLLTQTWATLATHWTYTFIVTSPWINWAGWCWVCVVMLPRWKLGLNARHHEVSCGVPQSLQSNLGLQLFLSQSCPIHFSP